MMRTSTVAVIALLASQATAAPILDYCLAHRDQCAISVHHVTDGWQRHLNADRLQATGSTFKVLSLIVYAQAVVDGRLDPEQLVTKEEWARMLRRREMAIKRLSEGLDDGNTKPRGMEVSGVKNAPPSAPGEIVLHEKEIIQAKSPCRICGGEASAVFNIQFKAVDICEGCAQTITIQQVSWMCDAIATSEAVPDDT